MPNKDYGLWYQVGVAVRQGLDVYPDPETGRLFPFMYPPSAAAMLGLVSLLGKHGTTLVAGAGELGGVGRRDRACRSGWRPAARPGARHPLSDRALALHHRADPQHVPAGPAEPVAADAAAGGVRLPAARAARSGRGRPRGHGRGDQGVSRSWPWATSSTAGCGAPRSRRSRPWPSGC